jgi:hypothetical protein
LQSCREHQKRRGGDRSAIAIEQALSKRHCAIGTPRGRIVWALGPGDFAATVNRFHQCMPPKRNIQPSAGVGTTAENGGKSRKSAAPHLTEDTQMRYF